MMENQWTIKNFDIFQVRIQSYTNKINSLLYKNIHKNTYQFILINQNTNSRYRIHRIKTYNYDTMSNSTSIRQDSFRSASVVNYSRDTVPELASEESLDYQDGNVALQSNYQFELSTQSSQIPMTEEQMKKILKGALDQMEERISQRIERLERRVGEIQKMVYKIPKPLEKREESPKKTILSHMSKVREMDQEQEEEEQQSNSQRQDEMIEQLPQSELDQSSGSPRMVRSVGYQGQQVREGESFMLRSVPVGRQFTYEELAQQAKELNKKCLKSIENFKKIIGKRS